MRELTVEMLCVYISLVFLFDVLPSTTQINFPLSTEPSCHDNSLVRIKRTLFYSWYPSTDYCRARQLYRKRCCCRVAWNLFCAARLARERHPTLRYQARKHSLRDEGKKCQSCVDRFRRCASDEPWAVVLPGSSENPAEQNCSSDDPWFAGCQATDRPNPPRGHCGLYGPRDCPGWVVHSQGRRVFYRSRFVLFIDWQVTIPSAGEFFLVFLLSPPPPTTTSILLFVSLFLFYCFSSSVSSSSDLSCLGCPWINLLLLSANLQLINLDAT